MSVPAVAYHPGVPRHLQIQRVLRSRIESGEWEAEAAIPTEHALAQRFGVSRTTIREALQALAADGLISRYRRRGSFVRPPRPRANGTGRVTNLVLGYQVEIEVVRVETIAAPAHIAQPLGVEKGSPLARFVRLEMAEGTPLGVAVNYMPEALGRRIRPKNLARVSMLELLRDRLGLELGTIRQSIEARLPDEEVASLLGIDLTQPVLFIRLHVFDAAGRPVEICDTSYRADRYHYEVETRLPPPGAGRDGDDTREGSAAVRRATHRGAKPPRVASRGRVRSDIRIARPPNSAAIAGRSRPAARAATAAQGAQGATQRGAKPGGVTGRGPRQRVATPDSAERSRENPAAAEQRRDGRTTP